MCPGYKRWFLLCLIAIAHWAGAANGPFERVRQFIQTQMVEHQAPSIAVAVARDGKILWEEGFGWADRENRIEATPHTMYSLASISKPITATGLMVLKERGKIDFDRPINDYLGEAKLRSRVDDTPATVRQVANHSSGLPLHYQFFYEDEPYRPPSMDETIRRYGNLVTRPGEKYQYSNLGYGILGYVISRLSGKGYADFMREEVFLPLGMTHASVGIGPRMEKLHAIRYGTDGGPIPFYDFDHPAASAVYASVHDLVRFGMFHLKAHLPDQKAILSDRAIDEMHKPTFEQAKGIGYGIGWATNGNLTYHTVSHTGGMGGVSTVLVLIPSERMAVAVLSNCNSSLTDRIRQEVVTALLPGQKGGSESPTDSSTVFKPSPELVGAWSGKVQTYKGETLFSLRFRESGDVHVRLGRQLETLLNDVRLRDGYVTGQMTGDIGTEDANRRPYILSLSLKLRRDVLNGAMTALSMPGRRAGNALSHWVELQKQ